MSVANKLKYAMGEKNKKRDDIANVLKISNQAVSNKFNRDSFSAEDLIKIADCLGVSLALVDNNKTIVFDLEDIKKQNDKAQFNKVFGDMRDKAAQHGFMTDEEINAEIQAAREEKKPFDGKITLESINAEIAAYQQAEGQNG